MLQSTKHRARSETAIIPDTGSFTSFGGFQEDEGAQIDTQGVGRLEAEEVVLAVTSGSGDYRNVRGEATFEFQGDGRVVITYEVDT